MKRFLTTLLILLTLTSTANAAQITQDRVIELVNADRLSLGFGALTRDSQLDLAAQTKAEEMFSHNLFDHFMPDGHTPWDFIDQSDYDYAYAGENLAMGWLDTESQHEAWMNSPTHRKNILNPVYKDIGVAVVEGVLEGRETTLVVQLFGERQSEDNFVFDGLTEYVGKILGVK